MLHVCLCAQGNILRQEKVPGEVKYCKFTNDKQLRVGDNEGNITNIDFKFDAEAPELKIIETTIEPIIAAADNALAEKVAEQHRMKVLSCSPTYNLVAFGNDSTVEVWDGGTEQVQTLHADAQVTACSFSNDGLYLTVGTNRGSLMTWKVQSGVRPGGLGFGIQSAEWNDPVQHLECNQVLADASKDQGDYDRPICSLSFPPNSKKGKNNPSLVAVGSYGQHALVIVDVLGGASGHPKTQIDAEILSEQFAPCKPLEPGSDEEEGAEPVAKNSKSVDAKDFRPMEHDAVICSSFDADMQMLAYGISNGRVYVKRLKNHKSISTLMFENDCPWSCAFTQVIPGVQNEGDEVKPRDVLGVSAGNLLVWDIERLEMLGPPIEQLFGYVDQPDQAHQERDAETVLNQVQLKRHLLFEPSGLHENRTLMQEAVLRRNTPLVKKLLDLESACAAVSTGGETTFGIALKNVDPSTVTLLFKYVAKLSPTQLEALANALPALVSGLPEETVKFMKDLRLEQMEKHTLPSELKELPQHVAATALNATDEGMLLEMSDTAYNAKVFAEKQNETSNSDTVAVSMKLVAIPGLADERILNTFASSQDTQVFNNPVVRAVLACVWVHLAKDLFYYKFFWYVFTLVCFFVFSILLATESPQKDLMDLTNTSDGIVTLVLDVVLALLSISYLYTDFKSNFLSKSAFDKGAGGFFSTMFDRVVTAEPLVIIGLFSCAFLLATIVLHILRDELVREISAVTSVLLLLNVLQYIRGFSNLGPLVRNVIKIVQDIGSFLILLTLIVLGFANAFNIMFSGSELKEYESFINTFMTTFGMMMGDFDLDVFADSADRHLMNVLFIGYVLLVNIVLLNMLIAIMGDTYARVSADAESEFQAARAQLIVGILKELSPEDRTLFKTRFKWIYAVAPANVAMSTEEDEKNELMKLNSQLEGACTKLDELTKLIKQKL